MTTQHRTRIGLASALAVASLVAAAPAGADPVPAQRGEAAARARALAQEEYYMSHKPAIPGPGHDFDTIAAAPVTATGANDFEWGDAAIGAGGSLALALVCAGGAAVVVRRRRDSTRGVTTG